jgi:hypothetical protein
MPRTSFDERPENGESYQLPFDNLTALIEHRPAAVTRLNRRIVGDQPGDRAAAPDAKRKGAGGRPILLSMGVLGLNYSVQ